MSSKPKLPFLLTLLFTTLTLCNSNNNNILDAIIASGDFNNWASILSSADPSILPVTATIFIPSDADYDAVSTTNSTSSHFSPFLLFPYHVIPERLSFADLLVFPTNTRLPTLLPGFSLLITNNSKSNFSIDGSYITHPDLYQNAAVSAHGIDSPFDYTLFGDFDYTAVFGNQSRGNGNGGHSVGPVSVSGYSSLALWVFSIDGSHITPIFSFWREEN